MGRRRQFGRRDEPALALRDGHSPTLPAGRQGFSFFIRDAMGIALAAL
jgi:hypothetical protein